MPASQTSHVLATAVGAVRELMEKRLRARDVQDDATLNAGLEELNVLWEELQDRGEQLARERQRFEDLFQFLPDACLITDVVGHIREANRAAIELLQISEEAVYGKPLTVFVAAEERGVFRSELVSYHAGEYEGAKSWPSRILPRGGGPIGATLAVRAINPPHPSDLCWLIRPTS